MHEDDDDHDKDDTFGSGVNTHDGGLEGLGLKGGFFHRKQNTGALLLFFWRCVSRLFLLLCSFSGDRNFFRT